MRKQRGHNVTGQERQRREDVRREEKHVVDAVKRATIWAQRKQWALVRIALDCAMAADDYRAYLETHGNARRGNKPVTR